MIELLTGPLLENPQRIGRELRASAAWSRLPLLGGVAAETEAVLPALTGYAGEPLGPRLRLSAQPLGRELAGVWSARRGTYRVLYRINEERQEVIVERIEHRSQSYRRR